MGLFDWLGGIFGGNSGTFDVSSPDVTFSTMPDTGSSSIPYSGGADILGNYGYGSQSYQGSIPDTPANVPASSANLAAMTAPSYDYPSPSTPSGGNSWWNDIMGTVGRGAGTIAPLLGMGTAGMGLYAGIKGMQDAAEQKQQLRQANEIQQKAGQSALASGQQLTDAGTAAMMGGALPAGLEARAKQYEDQLRAQYNNYLAKAGLGNSSSAQQIEGYVKQQAALYRQNLAESLLQPGSTNLGVASGSAARGVGQYQATQTGLGNALQSANQALASMSAVGQRKKPTEAA